MCVYVILFRIRVHTLTRTIPIGAGTSGNIVKLRAQPQKLMMIAMTTRAAVPCMARGIRIHTYGTFVAAKAQGRVYECMSGNIYSSFAEFLSLIHI